MSRSLTLTAMVAVVLLGPAVAQAQQTTTKEVYSASSKGNNAALQQLRYRAEQGDAIAQFDMGLLYRNGENVPYDVVQAVNWFRKAAEQGNTEAQTNLAYHYAVGEGVPKDAVQSNFWYSKADPTRPNPWVTALENNPNACFVAPCNRSGSPTYPKGLIEPGNIVIGNVAAKDLIEPANINIGNVAVTNAKKHAPMVKEGGVYKVPVLINDTITLKFVVDSGAADVSIPADVVLTLIRAETITQSDFIGAQTYTLADGSTTSSRTFRIRSLKVGDIVLLNVLGSVADTNGELLLGQSFLGRFKSWSIDNTSHTLILE